MPLWHECCLLIWLDINITAGLSDVTAVDFLKLIRPHFLPFNLCCFHKDRPQSYLQLQSIIHSLYIYYSTGKSYGRSHRGQHKTNKVASETSLRGFSWDFSNKTCWWGNSDRWASTSVWSVMSWNASRLPVDQGNMMKNNKRFFFSEHYWNHLEQ